MKRKILFLSLIITYCLQAEIISLKNSGWNLIGSNLDNAFIKSDFENIFQYKNNKWGSENNFSSGDGFWIKTNSKELTLNGYFPINNSLNIKKGWNLKSIKGDILSICIDENFNSDEIFVFRDNSWLSKDSLNNIYKYEGFWIKSSSGENVELKAGDCQNNANRGYYLLKSPFITVLSQSIDSYPLSQAEIYLADNSIVEESSFIGTTDIYGNFPITSNLVGKYIFIKKDGYNSLKMRVKSNGIVVPLLKIGDDFTSFETKVISQELRVFKNSFEFAKSIPNGTDGDLVINNVNDLNARGYDFLSKELNVIGGLSFEVQTTNGETLDLSAIEGVNLKVKQSKFIGDLEQMLNGFTKETLLKYKAKESSEKTFEKLEEAIEKKQNGLFVYQRNPKTLIWELKAKAKIDKNYDDTYYITAVNFENEEEFVFDNFGEIIFVLALKDLSGELNVCLKGDSIQSPDGKEIVKLKIEDIEVLDNTLITGSDNIITQNIRTATNGCAKIQYTTPLLEPYFQLNFKKENYLAKTVSFEVNRDESKDTKMDINLTKRAPLATIYGYVRDKATKDGLANALVTISNPYILIKEKVRVDDNGIELIYLNEFSRYTWEIYKLNDDGTRGDEILIKEGNTIEYSSLNYDEIIQQLSKPFDENSKPLVDNPLGDYLLNISVKTELENGIFLEERSVGTFAIDMNAYQFKIRTSPTISQGNAPIYNADKGVDAILSKNEISSLQIPYISLFGGKDLSQWYSIADGKEIIKNTKQYWSIRVVSELGDEYEDKAKCIMSPIIDGIYEPAIENMFINSNGGKSCIVDLIEADFLSEVKVYDYSSLLIYLSKNFSSLLKPDINPISNSKAYIKSGFGIFVTNHFEYNLDSRGFYKSDIESIFYLDEDAFEKIAYSIKVSSININFPDAFIFKEEENTFDKEQTNFQNTLQNIGYYEFPYRIKPYKLEGKYATYFPNYIGPKELIIKVSANGYKTDKASQKEVNETINSYGIYEYNFYLNSEENSTLN